MKIPEIFIKSTSRGKDSMFKCNFSLPGISKNSLWKCTNPEPIFSKTRFDADARFAMENRTLVFKGACFYFPEPNEDEDYFGGRAKENTNPVVLRFNTEDETDVFYSMNLDRETSIWELMDIFNNSFKAGG